MTREAKSWQEMNRYMRELLERKTGQDVDAWKAKIAAQGKLTDEKKLNAWLGRQGVTGYARMLLVFETFGYPDFFNRSGDELIDAQYEDRPSLRPTLDALLLAAEDLGDVTVQARKGYVSLVAQRQFAIVRATTKTRVDLGLRLEKAKPGGRWVAAKAGGGTQIPLVVGALWNGRASNGISMMKLVPRSGRLSTATLPPWASAAPRTCASPTPQPRLPPASASRLR